MQGTVPMGTPIANPGLPVSAFTPNDLNPGQDEPNVRYVSPFTSVQSFSQWHSSTPHWVTLIKPRPQAGFNVITLRRGSKLTLDINLHHLPRGHPAGCTGIKVPATGSVKNCANTTGKTLLEFRIRLYGATTEGLYENVCTSCQNREGKRRGIPGLIDFTTDSDMIEPKDTKDGSMRVEFVFCCYPKDHKLGDTEYL